ncbi:hypothetical protein ACFVJ5_03830 [Nocardia sp. NPDC127606]|uniref:hypothetical protein n=1 Tax=Nocardia sp. NPDC127606 TaxID=3345406 RepID=UPI00363AC038
MATQVGSLAELDRDIDVLMASTSASGLAEAFDSPDTRRKFVERQPKANDAGDGW